MGVPFDRNLQKGYAAGLRQRGIEDRRIRKYGFAFEGRKVLIGGA